MKKLIAILLLVCLMPLCALAEMGEDGGVTVALDGAEVYFVPMEGYCLTRESSASVFNKIGMSQRDIVPWMEQNDVYALMFSETLDVQIQIVAHPSTEMDFDEQSQFGLNMMCEAVENLYTTEGYDVESAEMCHTPNGHSYVRTSATYTYEDGYVGNMMEFFTCQSGYSVYVVMFTAEGAPTEAQIILCESVVDSLWLSEVALEGRWEEASSDGVAVRFRLPENVKYLTKNSSAEEWAGLPKSYVAIRKKELAWNDYQGLIMSPDAKWEIKWTLYDLDDASDLDEVSDEGAEEFREMYVASYQEAGSNVSHSAYAWIGSHRYLNVRFNYAISGSLNHAEEYYTLQNGNGVLVTLVGYDEPAPEEAQTLLQDILESQIIIVDR